MLDKNRKIQRKPYTWQLCNLIVLSVQVLDTVPLPSLGTKKMVHLESFFYFCVFFIVNKFFQLLLKVLMITL